MDSWDTTTHAPRRADLTRKHFRALAECIAQASVKAQYRNTITPEHMRELIITEVSRYLQTTNEHFRPTDFAEACRKYDRTI